MEQYVNDDAEQVANQAAMGSDDDAAALLEALLAGGPDAGP